YSIFFSSRRRHTRSKRDWSSDVCSSDQASAGSATVTNSSPFTINYTASDAAPSSGLLKVELWVKVPGAASYTLADTDTSPTATQIGRAACREGEGGDGGDSGG